MNNYVAIVDNYWKGDIFIDEKRWYALEPLVFVSSVPTRYKEVGGRLFIPPDSKMWKNCKPIMNWFYYIHVWYPDDPDNH
jgi:hypothetical protein